MDIVPTNVRVVGSSLTECVVVLVGIFSCVKIGERKARERVGLQHSMKLAEHKELKSGNAAPYGR